MEILIPAIILIALIAYWYNDYQKKQAILENKNAKEKQKRKDKDLKEKEYFVKNKRLS